MDDVKLRFGIPDVELKCAGGGTINPATFAGHQLIVLFLPADEQRALREAAQYGDHARDFINHDAWILAVAQQPPSSATLPRSPAMAIDPQGIAWNAFERLAERKGGDREAGAVYLFSRGGGLQAARFGPSHVTDIIGELHSDW